MSNPTEEKPYERLSNLEKALVVAKNSGNEAEIFDVLLNLGELCYDINAHELGLKYVQEAIELSKKDSQHLHEFYKYLGDFNYNAGMLDEASEAYNMSIKKASKKKFYRILAESHFGLGRVYHVQEKLKQAITHFKKAEKIYEEMDLPIEQARLYNKIGLIYMGKARLIEPDSIVESIVFGRHVYASFTIGFDKAKKYFKKAKLIMEENNLIETESVLYRSILSNLGVKPKDL